MKPPAVVELSGVSRSFPGPPEVHAVTGVDLVVEAGEYLSIVGPSGSGKSTLLHCMAGLDDLTSGQVLIAGQDQCRLGHHGPGDRHPLALPT